MSNQLSQLGINISTLEASGIDQRDPVAFQLIKSLYNKAGNHNERVSSILSQKIQAKLDAYQERYCKIADRTELHAIPESQEKIPPITDSPLKTLLQELSYEAPVVVSEQKGLAFDQLIQELETSIISEVITEQEAKRAKAAAYLAASPDEQNQTDHEPDNNKVNNNKAENKPVTDSPTALPKELRSVQQLRQSKITKNVEDLVNQAIYEGPEDPGPLNPQMLAIKSLQHMQRLSPHYLTRFIRYIDTLLWLEQADSKSK